MSYVFAPLPTPPMAFDRFVQACSAVYEARKTVIDSQQELVEAWKEASPEFTASQQDTIHVKQLIQRSDNVGLAALLQAQYSEDKFNALESTFKTTIPQLNQCSKYMVENGPGAEEFESIRSCLSELHKQSCNVSFADAGVPAYLQKLATAIDKLAKESTQLADKKVELFHRKAEWQRVR